MSHMSNLAPGGFIVFLFYPKFIANTVLKQSAMPASKPTLTEPVLPSMGLYISLKTLEEPCA